MKTYTHTILSLTPALAVLALNLSVIHEAKAGSWVNNNSLNTARSFHTATLLPNGQVLVAGGEGTNGGFLDYAELYDPATGKWTATALMNQVRFASTATLLPNGQVLVAAGALRLSSAELYDPATGTWTPTGSLTTARLYHTATLLPNGQVLVAGGSTAPCPLSSAELYDPATGTWTATGSMTTARESHTATLLPNGQVLVAGGEGQAVTFQRGVVRSGHRDVDGDRLADHRTLIPHGDVAAQWEGAGRRG